MENSKQGSGIHFCSVEMKEDLVEKRWNGGMEAVEAKK